MITARTMIQVGIVVAAITLFEGCRHLGTPEVAPASSHYPEKNSGPLRQVFIRGTVAPTLVITLSTIYEGEIASDCWTSPVFSAGEFEGSARPLKVTVPISVTRDSDRFSAAFEVDRFLPGKCGWHFAAVEVQVSKGNLSTGPAEIIQPYDQKNGESEVHNSSDDSVIMRCRDLGRVLGYSCVPSFPNKMSQILVDTTTVVNVKITDDDPKYIH